MTDEPAVPGTATRSTAAGMARAGARLAKTDGITHTDVLEAARLMRSAADLIAPLPPVVRSPAMRTAGGTVAEARREFLDTTAPAAAAALNGGAQDVGVPGED